MALVKLIEEEASNHLREWYDAYLSPTKRRGAIGVIQWEEKKGSRTVEKRKWITLRDANELLKMSDGTHKRLTNAYLTLNAFQEVEGQIRRQTANLAQIRNIGIDIDCYNVGLSISEAIDEIHSMIAQAEIPNPNLVIRSGNGLQLIYSIENGAAPSLGWLTKHITAQLIAKTSSLGSDGQCTDLTRVFRLPGSFNKKPGKAIQLVSVEVWRALEYNLSELYAYCEPLEHRKKRISKPALYPLPKLTDMGYKLRSLNLTRINDFYKLIDLRDGSIENRNILIYDFAYCFGLQTEIEQAVVQQANRLNRMLEEPLTIFEIERVAKNAFKDARAFWKAYLSNGYRMPPCRTGDGIIKPKKNSTLIKHHSITAEEMKDLQTIIDANEKQDRRVAKRRAAGMRTLEEHNNSQKAQRQERLQKLKWLKQDHPGASQRELAKLLGVSVTTVNQLLKEL